MHKVAVLGVGMHPFGKFEHKHLKDLANTAIWNAIEDAGIEANRIEAAFVGNCLGGLLVGQESVRGQVILRHAGFKGIPIVNVENACATASTAFRMAWLSVISGMHDVVLAVGVEKMFVGDTAKSIEALSTATDIDVCGNMGLQFTSVYAMNIRKKMDKYGWTKDDLGLVAEKNSYNGSLNPYAQFKKPLTKEEVLASKMIADPITLYMASPMGDGAAAAIICNERIARKLKNKPFVRVVASELSSGHASMLESKPKDSTTYSTALKAYEQAGVGPEDINLAEVHDAMSPAELKIYEELGFCEEGEAIKLIREGRTKITGDIPVNPSGGLASRGHPVGATGLAQIAEVVWQLRGEAGKRQVVDINGKLPRFGLTQNDGGYVEGDNAASCIHILSRV
ncbi:beta-ketoacyl synthase N-terminal-like domain-containing protein [Paenibacillus sp. BSR1-1]|uniref:thiolase C-terminal domain-containing protein n=1 Tax=Paenibacillus sp. BSR1-1 TaxID=3020845 RepID=UPI0025AF27E0|nr:beta-ketoacyl synthase N-terminal-like domain-containing protein [Paenibacillus sp. BSR1-1]MDN3016169.1 beta-ketoacyl synthase N-terminal-like domain-containing protein [Paenibacillus sp. BSR1-1]